jgi:very-short-patch-repair endonuclease
MEAPAATVARARSLRRRMTPPEVRLWVSLRRQVQGLRFRRQHPVGPFVVDFYCDAVRLSVEVDGQQHWLGEAQLHDIERDEWLALRGIRVIRLPARLIFQDRDAAIRTIIDAAKSPHP